MTARRLQRTSNHNPFPGRAGRPGRFRATARVCMIRVLTSDVKAWHTVSQFQLVLYPMG